MGDHIIIGEGSIINAQSIGSYVHIGKNCIIVSHTHVNVGRAAFTFVLLQSHSCILKDCCRVEDNVVLAPDTVVPLFTVFSGSPGAVVIVIRMYCSRV